MPENTTYCQGIITPELALLGQLESKYRMPVVERDQDLQVAVPPVDQTPVTPAQGSLF